MFFLQNHRKNGEEKKLFFLGGNKFGGCIFSGSLSEWAWQAQSRCGARQKIIKTKHKAETVILKDQHLIPS